MVKIIECPRDAFQGIKAFIPTDLKIEYLNLLLQVGFDTLDFGSFVSPKAIPQLQDTHLLMSKLEKHNTKLLAIVANQKGTDDALVYNQIDFLGYPFSISETFQLRNTNKTILEAFEDIKLINQKCLEKSKQLVTYISMGFGNPYNDQYSPDLACDWVEKLSKEGMKIFAISDTIGKANESTITSIFETLILQFPDLEFGAHFHSTPEEAKRKINWAYQAGCKRFDSAVLGIGGCPLAADELVGNTATETLISYLEQYQILPETIQIDAMREAMDLGSYIFNKYH